MKVKDFSSKQLKKNFSAAMGWHTNLNSEHSVDSFDEFYDQINFEWDEDRWTIRGKGVQIEITDELYFRCGMFGENISGVGGTAFNLKAVYEVLKEFECI